MEPRVEAASATEHLVCSKDPFPVINKDIIYLLLWFLNNFRGKIKKNKEEDNQNWWGKGATFFLVFQAHFQYIPADPPICRPESHGKCFAQENKLVYPLHVGFACESPPGVIPGIFCACIKTIPGVGWIWDERCLDRRSCNFTWNCFRT